MVDTFDPRVEPSTEEKFVIKNVSKTLVLVAHFKIKIYWAGLVNGDQYESHYKAGEK